MYGCGREVNRHTDEYLNGRKLGCPTRHLGSMSNTLYLHEKIHFLQRENEILKRLVKDGFFWMNYSSRDCDGCCSSNSYKFTSLQEFYDTEDRQAESTDGQFSYCLAPIGENGGYELNEEWSGGSWADY